MNGLKRFVHYFKLLMEHLPAFVILIFTVRESRILASLN
jgi:hypothetical protein